VSDSTGGGLTVHVNAPEAEHLPLELLRRAVRVTAAAEGVEQGELSLTLLDDPGIRELNRTYLSHDRVTDVLSFALQEEGEPPLGDVYVGLQQAARQASEAGVPLEEELVRLAVHGTLHVLGYDHPEEAEARLESPFYRIQEERVTQVMVGWEEGARGEASSEAGAR
jgi:probable rRNA maturation factor